MSEKIKFSAKWGWGLPLLGKFHTNYQSNLFTLPLPIGWKKESELYQHGKCLNWPPLILTSLSSLSFSEKIRLEKYALSRELLNNSNTWYNFCHQTKPSYFEMFGIWCKFSKLIFTLKPWAQAGCFKYNELHKQKNISFSYKGVCLSALPLYIEQ